MLQMLAQDLRYALRMLRKNPGFTAVAVLTLALGIGANTAIFSILDPLLLRKLPVSHPEELVRVDAAGSLGNAGAWEDFAFERFRDHSPVFSGVLAFVPQVLDDVSCNGQAGSARAEVISSNFFNVLGLHPFAGRLQAADQELGNTVVLGFDYWRREFGGDRAALGKSILVQGAPYTIIGIAPAEFFGMRVGEDADFYLPYRPGRAPNGSNAPVLDWTLIIGRLNPGVSSEQALTALAPVLQQIRAESQIPAVEQRQGMDHLVLTSVSRGLSNLRYRFGLPARILMCVVGLVLLIACANVANLLLAQGSARKREITVRLALGAQRRRLVRQLLTESTILVLTGAAAGLLAARWTSRLIVAALSDAQTHIELATPLSGRVLLFSLAATAVAVLLCGLAPAFAATRADLSQELKTNAARKTQGAPARLGGLLVVAQVAMSVTALVAGGMLLHSLINLETIDVGFDRDHVLVLDMKGNTKGHTPQQVKSFYDRLLEQADALPGVRSATFSSFAPVSGRMIGVNLQVEGYTQQKSEDLKAFLVGVRPGYFSTLGIPFLQGRDFTPQDSPSPLLAVVNQSLARRYFGDHDAVGRHIQFEESGRKFQIVGVVANSKYFSLREETTDLVYLDSLQSSPANGAMLLGALSVRVAGREGGLRNELAGLIRSLDPAVRITRVATLQERIDDTLHTDRLIAALCGIISLLALTLTGIGLYGILAFSVARRTSEIGIRMALGARRGNIFRLIVGQGMKVVVLGLVIGSVAALASTGLLRSLLFGVDRGDPLTFLGICLLLVAAAAFACYVPARRATQVDPMVALRTE